MVDAADISGDEKCPVAFRGGRSGRVGVSWSLCGLAGRDRGPGVLGECRWWGESVKEVCERSGYGSVRWWDNRGCRGRSWLGVKTGLKVCDLGGKDS